MGRVGASFLQMKVLDLQRWSRRADLVRAIATWIENTYQRKRRQRRLAEQHQAPRGSETAALPFGSKQGEYSTALTPTAEERRIMSAKSPGHPLRPSALGRQPRSAHGSGC